MIIGSRNSWLVNASTCHPGHFVGTRQQFGLTSRAGNKEIWNKLQRFALRFAAPGSTIKIFCFLKQADPDIPVAEFQKKKESLFQTPSCYVQNSNGVKVPFFVKNPILDTSLDYP